jgi:hypothetical protein
VSSERAALTGGRNGGDFRKWKIGSAMGAQTGEHA